MVESGMGSGELRVEGELESGEVTDELVPGSSECSNEGELVAKRPRLSEISTMADETIQSRLDCLPRDDLQYVALLLYGRLPTIFALQKSDTAAVVGEVLHKNECTWVGGFVSNGGEFLDSQQGQYLETTH